MLTSTVTANEITITLSGHVEGHAAALAPQIAAAVSQRHARRLLARKGGRQAGARVEAPIRVIVDIRGVTSLGIDGVGLLRGVHRTLPWHMDLRVHAGPWAPTMRLVNRNAMAVYP